MTYGITNAGGGKSADLGTKTITANGTYSAATDGLDGYSEVTANVQSAPTLQSKIARQNGTVTADQGYDGLSSVDVGVGQIGDTYSCANKTGNAIAQYDKVWLTYREVQPSQSVYAQPIYDYQETLAFVANNQQTGLLYRQSDNNGNLFNLLNFTVEDLSSLALFNTQYTVFAYQSGDKYFFCGGYNTLNTWMLDTSAQTMTVFANGAFKDYVTGFYTTYNRYSSRLYDPNGVSHTVPAGYDGMPGSGFCLYGYVKNGTTYMWYKDYNSGLHICSVDMDTYELTHVANTAGGTNLHITNKTSDSEYLLDCTSASQLSYRAAFKIISTTTYGEVTDSVLPTSWAGISSTPAVVQFDERTGILIAINAPTTSGNSLNLRDIKLAKYNPSTKVFDDITATVNLPDYVFYASTPSSYGINFWLSSDFTNFAICYRTSKSYGNPGVENTLTVLQLTPAEGWVISSMNNDALTGYAAANIDAGAIGNVIVGTKVDGTAITATNNSSYDRISGEKVWLLENNGSYQITDALGLTSRSFTGVCKEAIARGASGAVQATVGGALVTRWTRDFSTQGTVTIDDAAKLLTSTDKTNYIYKSDSISNIPTKLVFQLKYKLVSIRNTDFNYYLLVTTSEAPVASATCFGLGYKSYDPNNTSYGGWYPVAIMRGGSIDTPRHSSFNSVPIDTWVWVKATFNSGNASLQCSLDGETWETVKTGTYTKTPVCNGYFLRGMDCASSGVVYDLDKCYVEYDDQIVWQPYKPITE